MQLTIEIPDPPAGCDPAAVQWGIPPEGAMWLHFGMEQWIGPNNGKLFRQDVPWVMPYTPSFLSLLKLGWVTYDPNCTWVCWTEKPTWNGANWYIINRVRYPLPFRETPPISGEAAIWEVPSE